MTGGRRAALALTAMLIAAGCAAPGSSVAHRSPGASLPGQILGGPSHPLLALAIARGTDLGPLPESTPLQLTLGLAGRDPNGLQAVLASGTTLTPAAFAARFSPDPASVARARAVLAAAGLQTVWSPGATTMSAAGTAGAVDRFFGIRIDQRVGPDGVRFRAPGQPALVPQVLRPVVNGVTGLDDYPSARTSAIRSPNGVSPADMLDFYDVNPLRTAGLTGAGTTIAFIEIDKFDQNMLDRYAQKFNLPAFNVQVKPLNWGQPAKEEGEADLDLEIVHAIAPGAQEVVYYASSSNYQQAELQMYKDFPKGAIESSSVGQCESSGAQQAGTVINDASTTAAALGWSIFVASGDRGAYDCTPAGDATSLAADLDGGLPSITSVGGTYVLLSSAGGYFKEAAWGQPIEQWGGSGGVSAFWTRPSWQAGPGVQNQYSNGMRQTPDISANADGESGWDIFAGGMEEKVGGTSAAAPFWAACAALIDQDLAQKSLPLIGFANPALYLFATNPSGLPAPPFHDITLGTNLYYPATPGWDYATGIGSPDVAALADDFEWYSKNRPAG